MMDEYLVVLFFIPNSPRRCAQDRVRRVAEDVAVVHGCVGRGWRNDQKKKKVLCARALAEQSDLF
jgi:hypothetical protein